MAQKIIILLLIILSASLSVVATHPRWRESLRRLITTNDRSILAITEGSLQPGGPMIKILKIRSNNQISIEIYQSPDGGNQYNLIQSLSTPDRTDGYFTFQGNATNLALGDIDQDGFFEILVPTFDDQGVARLHTFKYDPNLQRFSLMAPQSDHN